MAVLILALLLTIITGAHYFGRNLTRPVWLVLFIVSALSLPWSYLLTVRLGFELVLYARGFADGFASTVNDFRR